MIVAVYCDKVLMHAHGAKHVDVEKVEGHLRMQGYLDAAEYFYESKKTLKMQ